VTETEHQAATRIPGLSLRKLPFKGTSGLVVAAPHAELAVSIGLEGLPPDAAVAFPIPWSLASDVAYASIAALDRGVRGEKYLAFAGSHEVSTMAAFCNRACEIAGVPHRVNEISAADLDASEDVRKRVGPSLIALAHQKFPEPYFVNQTTVERLDYHPRPLDDALRETVEWLYRHDLVS